MTTRGMTEIDGAYLKSERENSRPLGTLAEFPGSKEMESDPRADLIQRVLTSDTFARCSRLKVFLEYVYDCALRNEPADATEQMIGIHVFGRQPGYNASQDNIVRSQARLLRLKLEHHFANEGKEEPWIITIPKGQYLPVLTPRIEEPEVQETRTDIRSEHTTANGANSANAVREFEIVASSGRESGGAQENGKPPRNYWRLAAQAMAVVLVLVAAWYVVARLRAEPSSGGVAAGGNAPVNRGDLAGSNIPLAAPGTVIRIAAGDMGGAYVDASDQQWGSDKDYAGGISRPGPRSLYPPVANPGMFKFIREGAAGTGHGAKGFRYDIPVPPGVYQLKLYFADPLRDSTPGSDGQNLRYFIVKLNGRPLLTHFDAVADAGASPVDIRVFKDVSPAPDGKIHLNFLPGPGRPFVSALELSSGIQGKLRPIRISARKAGFVDSHGIRWSGDEYYIDGTRVSYQGSKSMSAVPELDRAERYGNFSYAIPVPPGKYTVRLHFLASYQSPSSPNQSCWGPGCRVFDVSCNGQMLLKDFDLYKAADGKFNSVVRTFYGLQPNGQGKLLLSFSPIVNDAEVRAIEVIDEGGGKQRK